MAARATDLYTNRALVDLTMTAANTLSFTQVRFAVGLFQGVALVISRIEYFVTESGLRELAAVTDSLEFGITLRDDLVTIDPSNLSVLTQYKIVAMGAGTEVFEMPFISHFENLPEGGMLVPANPLFFAVATAGAAAATRVRGVIYYRFKTLSDKEYLEILQNILPGNV